MAILHGNPAAATIGVSDHPERPLVLPRALLHQVGTMRVPDHYDGRWGTRGGRTAVLRAERLQPNIGAILMAKIVHLTDSHVLTGGARLAGIDTLARLKDAVAHIRRTHADAELCVFTGDLAERGLQAEYEAVREALAPLPMPVRCTMGNHDDRAAFLSVFRDAPVDAAGYIQHDTIVGQGEVAVLCLDTLKNGSHAGELCERRLSWLTERLRAHQARHAVIVMMHHHPMDLGISGVDAVKLHATDALHELLVAARNVRLVCVGHAHRPAVGSWSGVSVVGGASVSAPIRLDLRAGAQLELCDEAPMLGVLLTSGRDVVYHFEHIPRSR